MNDLKNLQLLLDVKDPETLSSLEQAFIHRSYLNENKTHKTSNERLEFLGDSILSFLTSHYLYQKFPGIPEGELTNLRSSMVKTTTLAQAAKSLDLGQYLRLSKGEEDGGGRNNPSILADTFEALLGAIFLAQGLPAVKKLLINRLFPVLEEILAEKTYKDSKSLFQELVQETVKASPIYKVIGEKGPDHAKEFTVGVFVADKLYGTGNGRSKQEAETAAAKAALEKWERK